MDALEELRQMHVEAKSSFQKIEQASPDERGPLWAKLRPELMVHEQVEERFVYDPVTQEIGDRDQQLADWHQQHEQQVQQVNRLISEIGRADPKDNHFVDLVRQLREALTRHIEMEENEFWPRIRQVWGSDKLEQAGRQVQAARSGASASGGTGKMGEANRDGGKRQTRR